MTPQTLTLTPEQLDALIAAAVARALARPVPPADAWLGGPEAAEYVYGRADRLNAWHRLRQRHPQIDAHSVGEGRARRWRRADLDQYRDERARSVGSIANP